MERTSSSIRATYLATEYRHEGTGWGIYLLKGADDEPVAACGKLSRLPIVGESVTATGSWSRFQSKGKVFAFDSLRAVAPRNQGYFVDYLAAIGEIPTPTAKVIVDAFGKDTLLVLSRSPERLEEIQEVTESHRERLVANWRSHRQQDHLEDELSSSGLNPDLLIELSYRLPPELTVQEMLSSDPWLIYLYSKTPFYLVKDFVASTGSVEVGHFLEAGIVATARRALMQGNQSVSKSAMARQVSTLLGLSNSLSADQVDRAVDWLIEENLAHQSTDGSVVLSEYLESRSKIHERLSAISTSDNEITDQLSLSQVEKLLAGHDETAALIPHAHELLCFLQRKVGMVHSCHPVLDKTFERVIDSLAEKLHIDVTSIHTRLSAASTNDHSSLDILGRSAFGPPEKGLHDPIDADIVVVYESHLLTTEDMKGVLAACEDDAVVILIGNLFSRSLHVAGSPFTELKDHLPLLNFDRLFRETDSPKINQILDLAQGRWTAPAEDSDIDINLGLVPVPCPDNEIEDVVKDICFGELIEALGLNSTEDTQIIIPKPAKRETVPLLKAIETSYAKSLSEKLDDDRAYRAMLRSPISRLNLPMYVTGLASPTAAGGLEFRHGSDTFNLYSSESKHAGVAYLAQVAHAQQIQRHLIVVVLPSGESMSNEDLLCAMGCATSWTFLVGSPENIQSKNLESANGL